MHYIERVKVGDSLGSLAEEKSCFYFAECVFGILVKEQVALFCVVHEHINVAVLVKRIPEGDDVRVLDLRVQAYLSFD